MSMYKKLFMQYMDENGIRYTELDEFLVKVAYNGDNLNTITVKVSFDHDGDNLASFYCFEIINMKGKESEGYTVCNKLNNQYRWVKFYMDDDEDIICQTDAYLDTESCGEECMYFVRQMVSITDKAFVEFAKAKFN